MQNGIVGWKNGLGKKISNSFEREIMVEWKLRKLDINLVNFPFFRFKLFKILSFAGAKIKCE